MRTLNFILVFVGSKNKFAIIFVHIFCFASHAGKPFSGFWFLFLNSDCRYFESFVILTILANCVFLVVECAPEEAE